MARFGTFCGRRLVSWAPTVVPALVSRPAVGVRRQLFGLLFVIFRSLSLDAIDFLRLVFSFHLLPDAGAVVVEWPRLALETPVLQGATPELDGYALPVL